MAAELLAAPRGQRDRQKVHAHAAETAAKRPKQTAEEVCFSGDKLKTLLFQSLCLQVKAEAQAGFVQLSHLRGGRQRACLSKGLGWPYGGGSDGEHSRPLEGPPPGLLTPDQPGSNLRGEGKSP